MGLEMLVDPQAWIVKDEDTLWDMNQPRLCGLFIPPFQRPLVWEMDRKIAFIESAYLGIHLGTIVFNDALNLPMVDGRFDPTDRWLIDGQQRCNALWSYVNDEFPRSEEHTSELQSLMRISYAVFCLKKQKHKTYT